MMNILSSILLVLAVIFIVPFLVYGTLSALGWIKNPKGSPSRFLLGVLISKTGVAIAFVLVFHLAHDTFAGHWLAYAFIWWGMFVLEELGQALGPNYSWKEAAAGILSETVYFPLSAFITNGWIN